MNTEQYAVLAVMVALAFVLGTLARRARISAAVGYLMAGIIVGLVAEVPQELVTALGIISEISVALLLFEIGYEIHVKKVQQLRGAPAYVTFLELITSLALVTAIAPVLGMDTGTSLVLGVSGAFASTVFTFKLMEEIPPTRDDVGRLVLMTLAAEDVAIVAVLTMLSAGTSDLLGALEVIAVTMAVAVGVYWGGSIVLPKVIDVGESGLILLISYGLLSAFASSAAGLSPSIGAFVAGITASKLREAEAVMEKFRPVRAVFILLFLVFMGVETAATMPGILAHPVALVTGLLLVPIHLVTKALATLVGGGLGLKYGIEAGLYLSTLSELSLLIAYTAVGSGAAEPYTLPAVAIGVSAGSVTASALVDRKYSIIVRTLKLIPRKVRWVVDALSLSIQRQAESRIHGTAYHLFHIVTHSAGEAVIATVASLEILKHAPEILPSQQPLATTIIVLAYTAVTARLIIRAVNAAKKLAEVLGAPPGITRLAEVVTASLIVGVSAEAAAILVVARYGERLSALTGTDLAILAPTLLILPLLLSLLTIALAALKTREA